MNAEGRDADGQDILHNPLLQGVDAAVQVDAVVFVTQTPDEVDGSQGLRQEGCVGCSCDAPSADVDEDVVEQEIDAYAKQHGYHGFVGMPHYAQHIGQSVGQVGDDDAVDDDDHVGLGIRKRCFAGTEEIEYLVDEHECQNGKHKTYNHVQRDDVAHHAFGCSVVALA